MTTNKPEVVAWRWRKPVVNDQGETVGATTWELGDAPGFLPWWTNDPLIRLRDYEALQAECEELRKDAERYRQAMVEVMRQVDGNIRETVRDCVNGGHDVQDIYDYCDLIEEAIDAALAGKGATK